MEKSFSLKPKSFRARRRRRPSVDSSTFLNRTILVPALFQPKLLAKLHQLVPYSFLRLFASRLSMGKR
jgi:hypothetical protein